MTKGVDGRIFIEGTQMFIQDGERFVQTTKQSTGANGNSIWTVSREVDKDNDGKIDYTMETTYEYNKEGNQVIQTETIDDNLDGTIDYKSETTFEYDKNGNLVKVTGAVDKDGDGKIDQVYGQREKF